MNRFFLYIFFLVFNCNYVFSGSIYDFSINGIKLGESLLKYFSIDEIIDGKTSVYDDSDNYMQISFKQETVEKIVSDDIDLNTVSINDTYTFALNTTNNLLIIDNLTSAKFYDDFKNCDDDKKNYEESLKYIFPQVEPNSYEYTYEYLDDGKSIAYVTDFTLNDGIVRLYCINWSKFTEKSREWKDNLSLDLSTIKFQNFINSYD